MNSPHFNCKNCSREVSYVAWGTKNRNHCSYCLYSLHVDDKIGDRSSNCGGLMPSVAKMYKEDGEEVLVHECRKCGTKRKNRVAGDDNEELIEKLPTIDYF